MSRTAEPLTIFNVLRLRRDVGRSAQIGLIGTATSRFEQTGPEDRRCPTGELAMNGARCFRDAYVGGVDASWRSLGGNYAASGQLVAGIVERGQTETQLDGTEIRPGDGSAGGWVRIAKEGGRPILADVTYTGLGRKLTFNDLGFMLRQNLNEVKVGFELRSLERDGRALRIMLIIGRHRSGGIDDVLPVALEGGDAGGRGHSLGYQQVAFGHTSTTVEHAGQIPRRHHEARRTSR